MTHKESHCLSCACPVCAFAECCPFPLMGVNIKKTTYRTKADQVWPTTYNHQPLIRQGLSFLYFQVLDLGRYSKQYRGIKDIGIKEVLTVPERGSILTFNEWIEIQNRNRKRWLIQQYSIINVFCLTYMMGHDFNSVTTYYPGRQDTFQLILAETVQLL